MSYCVREKKLKKKNSHEFYAFDSAKSFQERWHNFQSEVNSYLSWFDFFLAHLVIMNFPSPYRVHFSSDSLIAATSGFNGFRGFLNLALLLLVSNLKRITQEIWHGIVLRWFLISCDRKIFAIRLCNVMFQGFQCEKQIRAPCNETLLTSKGTLSDYFTVIRSSMIFYCRRMSNGFPTSSSSSSLRKTTRTTISYSASKAEKKFGNRCWYKKKR